MWTPVWQKYQAHLTLELLPSTWSILPPESHMVYSLYLSNCSNVGFSSLNTPYKKHSFSPLPQAPGIPNYVSWSLPYFLFFLTHPKDESSFFFPRPFISLSLWSISSTLCYIYWGFIFLIIPWALPGQGSLCLLILCLLQTQFTQ